MKTPFLILGYERSGTTMLRRLMSMHPDLPCFIVHERSEVLFGCKTKEQLIRKLPNIIAGQKIPYTDKIRPRKALKKFLGFFPEASVIHIIRDPIGAINSQVRRYKRDQKRCVGMYFGSVPSTKTLIDSLPNQLEVHYDKLISNPMEQLDLIYRWMGQEVDPDLIQRIISTRRPWEYNGKHMIALGYADSVGPTNQKMLLTQTTIDEIEKRKQEFPSLQLPPYE